MALLTFSDVSKDYGAAATAVRKVNFQMNEGEFTALAGPSGSGKTTILNLAAGLDRPNSGLIHLMDREITRMSKEGLSRFRRQSIGIIFQSYNLFPVLTAIENVEYPLALKHMPTKKRKERATQALAEVGLAGFEKRRPNQLSGGQQQRVAVARAIVGHPQIVFADEPTANLDSESTRLLLDLFSDLNKRLGITFLFSSHDASVLTAARRILHVRDGQIRSEELK